MSFKKTFKIVDANTEILENCNCFRCSPFGKHVTYLVWVHPSFRKPCMEYRDKAGTMLEVTKSQAELYLNYLAYPKYDKMPFWPPTLAYCTYHQM